MQCFSARKLCTSEQDSITLDFVLGPPPAPYFYDMILQLKVDKNVALPSSFTILEWELEGARQKKSGSWSSDFQKSTASSYDCLLIDIKGE